MPFFIELEEYRTTVKSLGLERENPGEYIDALLDLRRGELLFKDLHPVYLEAISKHAGQGKFGFIEIGAGRAHLVPGIKTWLHREGHPEVPILYTDIGSYPTRQTIPDVLQALSQERQAKKLSPLHPEYIKRLNESIISYYGEEADATHPDYYKRLMQHFGAFNVERAALLMRQPEISDDNKEATFRSIIRNMVTTTINKGVPMLLLVSSKIISQERSFDEIERTLKANGYQCTKTTTKADWNEEFSFPGHYVVTREFVTNVKGQVRQLLLIDQQGYYDGEILPLDNAEIIPVFGQEQAKHYLHGRSAKDARAFMLVPVEEQ